MARERPELVGGCGQERVALVDRRPIAIASRSECPLRTIDTPPPVDADDRAPRHSNVDRLRLGHVVDFILFHTPDWSFAVFNLADSFITVGAMLIILQELLDLRGGRADNA